MLLLNIFYLMFNLYVHAMYPKFCVILVAFNGEKFSLFLDIIKLILANAHIQEDSVLYTWLHSLH
jgi:hypothetical protein